MLDARWIARERPDQINVRLLSRGHTGNTPLPGLRDAGDIREAADGLQDCGWFPPRVSKSGGRPRSDFLIADGLWAALDDLACQNGQYRQNSAAGAMVEGSVGFGGFVSKDATADKQEEACNRMVADQGDVAVDRTLHEGDGVFASPTTSEADRIAPKEDPSDLCAETRLDRLIAKKWLALSHHRL
jgi:hypothetical protein